MSIDHFLDFMPLEINRVFHSEYQISFILSVQPLFKIDSFLIVLYVFVSIDIYLEQYFITALRIDSTEPPTKLICLKLTHFKL